MISLKQKAESLQGKGFYSPEWTSYKRDCNELFNKVAEFITKEIQRNGCLVESSYIYLVYNAIHDGKFSFTKYKKNFFSTKEIIKM